MANQNENDPSAMFRDWVTQWERAVDSFSNQLMASDDFSRSMNKFQNTQLQYQKMFGELMAQQLARLNMPTRQDVQQIAESIRGLESRMERMESRLDSVLKTSDPATSSRRGPPRTKKPKRAAQAEK